MFVPKKSTPANNRSILIGLGILILAAISIWIGSTLRHTASDAQAPKESAAQIDIPATKEAPATRAIPPAESTKQVISTKSTGTSTSTQNGFYDDFQNPAYEGAFDPGKWSIDAGASSSTQAFQRDGVLILSASKPTTGQGIILGMREWTASTFNFFEAKIKVDDDNGENGNITMNVTSPAIPAGYKEYGLGGYFPNVTRVFLAGDNGNNIFEKDIKRGIWHTLKVVFNRDENTLTYYFDGNQFSIYKIPKKISVLYPSIQLWHSSGSFLSGALDEVKVGR